MTVEDEIALFGAPFAGAVTPPLLDALPTEPSLPPLLDDDEDVPGPKQASPRGRW